VAKKAAIACFPALPRQLKLEIPFRRSLAVGKKRGRKTALLSSAIANMLKKNKF
jgi:hypothetical protein